MSERHGGKRAILASHEFFEGLPDAALDGLAAMGRTTFYPAAATIFAKGDEGLGLLAVLDGIVKISVVAEDGRELVLNLIGRGELFGEIALLDGLPRTADASALTDCHLLELDRRSFLPLLRAEPLIAIRLLEVVSRRLRRTSEQAEGLSFERSSVRLAKALFRLAGLQKTSDMAQPRVEITQRELGQTVGLSRESTNKQLREWEAAGLIALEKGACVIRDPTGLRRAGCIDTPR
jgi:CRP-like cAMP-binding protein